MMIRRSAGLVSRRYTAHINVQSVPGHKTIDENLPAAALGGNISADANRTRADSFSARVHDFNRSRLNPGIARDSKLTSRSQIEFAINRQIPFALELPNSVSNSLIHHSVDRASIVAAVSK